MTTLTQIPQASMHQLNAQAWFKNVKNVWMYKHRVIFDSYLRVFFGAANI